MTRVAMPTSRLKHLPANYQVRHSRSFRRSASSQSGIKYGPRRHRSGRGFVGVSYRSGASVRTSYGWYFSWYWCRRWNLLSASF